MLNHKVSLLSRCFSLVKVCLPMLFLCVVFANSVWAEEYTLTNRVMCTDTGYGLPGTTMSGLESTDILNVTDYYGQMYFTNCNSTEYNVNCQIKVAGNAYGTEKTGKFRMQMKSAQIVNINGVVTMTGDTMVGSHEQTTSCGTLYFKNQITSDTVAGTTASFIIAPGSGTPVYLSNATANKNNYTGNTQLGADNLLDGKNYAGVVYLDYDEQIPDVLTNGTSCTGNLILKNGSTLHLNGHTETINGLSSDGSSVITGDTNTASTLIVGADNSSSTYSGYLQGSMNLTKIGTGTLKINTSKTQTSGKLTVSGGTLTMLADSDSSNTFTPTSVNINGTSTFGFEYSSGTYHQIWFNAAQSFTFDENGGGTIDTNNTDTSW